MWRGWDVRTTFPPPSFYRFRQKVSRLETGAAAASGVHRVAAVKGIGAPIWRKLRTFKCQILFQLPLPLPSRLLLKPQRGAI